MRLTEMTTRRLRVPTAALAVLGVVGACTVGGTGRELARLKQIECPSRPPAASIAQDLSQTGRSPELMEQRLAVIREVLTETAVCGGRVHVVAFSESATASRVLLDAELVAQGATENARLRRVPGIVDDAMKTIETETRNAMKALPTGGSDVLAQLTLAQEYGAQLGDRYLLRVYVLSDGVSTTNPVLNTPTLTIAVAQDLAQRVVVPSFPRGTTVELAGIGRVAGSEPPPTGYLDALKRFWLDTCMRTTADCTVVTDFTNGS